MDEPSANSFFVVLLFVLRCFVPLAILFGISYLLRRMGLVAVEAPEPKEEAVGKTTEDSGKAASSSELPQNAQFEKPKKQKVSPPRKKTSNAGKKPARKTKAGTSRSRSK